MSLNQFTPSLFQEDNLYCSEEQWDEAEQDSSDGCFKNSSSNSNVSCPVFPLPGHGFGLILSDEEMKNLFFKEAQSFLFRKIEKDQALVESRNMAVDWILKVRSFYSFSALTAVLAANYLDRFIFLSLQQSFTGERPWMTQLAAVACLSLAAKVEEIHVPLLLDLQVEETKYVFEAKTIQKMEILVLSTLDWKMNPVNPLAFLDQFTSRLGWTGHSYQRFLQRCELVILLALYESRYMSYLPSVMATATMLHVISDLQPSMVDQVGNQLRDTLGVDKAKVRECCQFIRDLISQSPGHLCNKRKFGSIPGSPGSPNGVIDASFSSDDGSNSSWSVTSSVTSSPEPNPKRGRMDPGYLHCASGEVLNIP